MLDGGAGGAAPDLREHLRTVAFRALSVSRRIGLDRGAIDDIFLAAELHDIGLLTVPESVLKKRDLARSARSRRSATTVRGRIIAAAPELACVAEMISVVSERYDGSGDPDGLVAEQIPIGARILRVCIALAALTAERPYRQARSREEALEELRAGAGTDHDRWWWRLWTPTSPKRKRAGWTPSTARPLPRRLVRTSLRTAFRCASQSRSRRRPFG